MSRLQNKTALITGGTSGIGIETARQFIAEGARVVVTGSSAASVEAARRELGDQAIVIQADAGDAAGQKAVADTVKEAFGTLDILFVNAGVAEFGPLEQWSEAAFDRSVAINVKGPFFLIQSLLPIFSKQAAIVLNTSINAHIGMPNSSVYSLTKGIADACQDPVGRTDRPRHPGQRRQPGADRHAALQQARGVGSRFQGDDRADPVPNPCRPLREPQRSREDDHLSRLR